MGAPSAMGEKSWSEDLFLGGRVVVYQPLKGHHRSGSDAVLLAASLPADLTGHGFDFGSASGAAGLCLVARLSALSVTLVDIDRGALDLSAAALKDPRNAALRQRVDSLHIDLCATESERIAAGIARESADFVLCNPPYFKPSEVRASPQLEKAAAHVLGNEGFLPWIKAAASVLKPGGLAAFIVRAEGLHELLIPFNPRFGDIRVLPLHPYPNRAASHVIIQGRKGRKGPIRYAFPWTLRERRCDLADNDVISHTSPHPIHQAMRQPETVRLDDVDLGYTAETDAVLRQGRGIDIAARL